MPFFCTTYTLPKDPYPRISMIIKSSGPTDLSIASSGFPIIISLIFMMFSKNFFLLFCLGLTVNSNPVLEVFKSEELSLNICFFCVFLLQFYLVSWRILRTLSYLLVTVFRLCKLFLNSFLCLNLYSLWERNFCRRGFTPILVGF